VEEYDNALTNSELLSLDRFSLVDSIIQHDDLELESDGNNLLAIEEDQIDKEDYEGASLDNAYNDMHWENQK
jgi:hypothetical protein